MFNIVPLLALFQTRKKSPLSAIHRLAKSHWASNTITSASHAARPAPGAQNQRQQLASCCSFSGSSSSGLCFFLGLDEECRWSSSNLLLLIRKCRWEKQLEASLDVRQALGHQSSLLLDSLTVWPLWQGCLFFFQLWHNSVFYSCGSGTVMLISFM